MQYPIRFIHIKKNGGTSVYKFLRKNGVKFLIGDNKNMYDIRGQHKFAKLFQSEPSWKFSVVRNPYTRMISFYNWTLREKKYQDMTFEDFITNKFNQQRANGAWIPQTDYITDNQGNIIVDKIFYFEDLGDNIREHFQISKKFPHLNKATHDSYETYYTPKTKSIVYNHFAKDFNTLGYKK